MENIKAFIEINGISFDLCPEIAKQLNKCKIADTVKICFYQEDDCSN